MISFIHMFDPPWNRRNAYIYPKSGEIEPLLSKSFMHLEPNCTRGSDIHLFEGGKKKRKRSLPNE